MKMTKLIFLLLNLFIFLNNVQSKTPKCFRSAVYEHIRIEQPMNIPLKVLNNNFEIYKKVTKRASKLNTTILVFPEYGLFPSIDRKTLLMAGVSSIFPKLNTNLCSEFKKKLNKILSSGFSFQSIEKLKELEKETEKLNANVTNNIAILRKLSCLSSDNNIHIAVSLLELEKNETDYHLYNSLVVFDNNGKLIAKYRKYRPFGEKAIDRIKKPEIVTFNTKYGKFGILICFDIIFSEPLTSLIKKENINHLIFSTAWYDNEPSLSALSLHSAVSIRNGINILSANKRNLKLGGFGSGIYTPNGVKIQTTFNNKDLLLIADLPTSNNTLSNECDYTNKITIDKKIYKSKFNDVFNNNVYFQQYNTLNTPLTVFKYKKLKDKEGNLTDLCYGDVCCHLKWKMNDDFNFPQDKYYLMVTNRLKQTIVENEAFYEENCALGIYNKKSEKFEIHSSTRFDRIVLRGKFNTTTIYPNILSNNLKVIPKSNWNFKQNENEAEISFDNLNNPIASVTLYARNYDKDPN